MTLKDHFNGRLALVALTLLLCTAPAVLAGNTPLVLDSGLLATAGPADCGDGDIDPGETCERPGDIVGPADQACRDDCTYCGDGVVQPSEECDDGNGRDTDGCRNSCVLPVCGDGLASHGNNETCDPPGQPAGGNGNDCRGDCTVCGDGVVDAGEECDDANGTDGDTCRNNCTSRFCGDGVVDADRGEECDDGNTDDNDGCHNNCLIPVCGDGVLDGQNGETCERPGDIVGPSSNACRDTCTFCGDGVVQAGEDCDDANARDTDSCPNSCSFSVCGDGTVDPNESCDPPGSPAGASGNPCRDDCTVCGDGHVDGGEGCDDGNNSNDDGCTNDCVVQTCGDGIADEGIGETCDPPGSPAGASGNPCRDDCTVCGDGHVDSGEGCDDGNDINDDGCANDCTVPPACGDGVVDSGLGETCDPPGSPAGASGNPCRDDCTVCGDGHVDPGEGCDDGNDRDGDGCTPDCQSEASCDIRVIKTCSVPGDGDDDDDDDPMDGDDDDDDGDGDDPMDGDDDDDDDRDGYRSGRTVDNDDCAGNVVSMKLRYTAEGCEATTNSQSGLAGCWGDASNADRVTLQVSNDSGGLVYADEQDVFLGDIVDVRAFNGGRATLPPRTAVWIDHGMENVILDTSCAAPISVGDHFGSLQVVQLTTTDGGTVTLPPADPTEDTSECTINGPGEVVYTYRITNESPVAVENLTVYDSELGDAPGSPFARLESKDTLVLHASAVISETTTNTVTVSGVLETGEVCPDFEDSATVTVGPPDLEECSSKIDAMLLQYIGPDIEGPVTVDVLPRTLAAPVTYDFPDGLTSGTVLSSAEQNGFTVDPGTFGEDDAGSKTSVFINGGEEEHHTSCSVPYVAGMPAPLNEPKGDPSPNWSVVDFTQK